MDQRTHHLIKEFYVHRKYSPYIGNAPVWWKKGDAGYTHYLEGAKRFGEEAAMALVQSNPEKWAAYPCDLIDRRAHIVFDEQELNRLEEMPDYENSEWPTVNATALLSSHYHITRSGFTPQGAKGKDASIFQVIHDADKRNEVLDEAADFVDSLAEKQKGVAKADALAMAAAELRKLKGRV